MGISRRALLAHAGTATLVASLMPASAETATYLYDALGRLVRVTYSGGTIVVYDYDAAGNRSRTCRTDGSTFVATIQVAGTGPVNLRTLADASGYCGVTDATITFQVGSAVTIMGAPGGGPGIDTGVWPTDKTISLALQVSGKVYGGGGAGAAGAGTSGALQGGVGGDAVRCQHNISITVNSGGQIRAGGGGGGGGGAWHREQNYEGVPTWFVYTGGGGGGGFPNGPGGPGGEYGEHGFSRGQPGSNGTTSGGGAGGAGGNAGIGRTTGAGGAGAGAAATGSSGVGASGTEDATAVKFAASPGGGPGYAIRKNGHAVSVTNNGTISGTVG
ncbi:MAG TPA: RHS repeat domain-containing protein [Vitreimonas sp.]|uniref:RHS repeat domain-containing protein n=1 Tax=Vitreimonas sp. TaxID=3069702 RepID=UPI002D51D4D4|nr:RHS repeat domain-containing protein [Vitreimonas sp.]HYD86270.1 RHS repeat domain-containing protein [Vitreimonas sp.]